MKSLKRICTGVLAGALAISLTACSDTSWAAESQGERLPAGVYLYNLMGSYAEIVSEFDSSVEEKDYMKQQVNGVSFEQAVTEETQKRVRQYYAVSQKFDEFGLTLSDEYLAGANQMVESQWPYLESLYTENGISKDSFSKMVTNRYKSSAIFEYLYAEGGVEEVPSDELWKAFEDQYFKAQYMAIRLTGTDGNALEGEALEETKKLAQDYVDRANKGENFEDLMLEQEKKVAAESGQEESAVHTHEGGEHTYVVAKDAAGYPEAFLNGFSSAAYDTVVSFEDESYIYIGKRLPLADDTENFENYRTTLLSDLKGDEFTQLINDWADAVEISFNEAAVSRYTAKKVKMS